MTTPCYETSDHYLASFLLHQGAQLLSHERVSPRRTLFRFAADATLHELVRGYTGSNLMPIVPKHLFAALFRLKCLIRRPCTPTHPC